MDQKQKGATLVGLLFAVAIIAVSLAAGLTLMSRIIRLSSVSKHEITASALAEEGVELIRNIRDAGDNYCLQNGLALNGFNKLESLANDGSSGYVIDYSINNYTPNFPSFPPTGINFDNSSAGLCQKKDPPKAFRVCSIGFSGDANYTERQFIRKIQVLNSSFNDGNGGTIDYSYCQEGGLMIVSTVYWKEPWESGSWPANSSSDSLWKEDNTTLHKARVTGCSYNWRPE